MSEIVNRKLRDLKPLANNPRKIDASSMATLCEALKRNPEHFEARPLILSDRTGELVIIAGNQRYRAAKKIGLKEVPTVLLEGLTEEKEREIAIRDNVNNGDWDLALLEEWIDLPLAEFGLELPEIGVYEDFQPASIEEQGQLDAFSPMKCPNCGHEFSR